MQARRYRSLILRDGYKAPDPESIRAAKALAVKAQKAHWKDGAVKKVGAIHAFTPDGSKRVCWIERDPEGLGVTVRHVEDPALVFEVPIIFVAYGVPDELVVDEKPKPKFVAGGKS